MRHALGILLALLAVAPGSAGGADLKFEGAERVAQGTESYAEITWPASGEPRTWPTVGGELRIAVDRLPADTSLAAAGRDYAQALAAGGYTVVARCQGEECFGRRFKRHIIEMLDSQRLTAERGWPTAAFELMSFRELQIFYAERGLSGARSLAIVLVGRAQPDYRYVPARNTPMAAVVTLREAPPTLGRVKVHTAGELAAALQRDGRQALYGIFFDTDSAVVKPESQSQVAELVKFLQANPAQAIYVVGHTDMIGPLERNLDLSKRRAESVVAALTAAGIPAARVTPRGVGPLAPVASNAEEAGRALNRRVEIVAR
jgi:outer membrane protein OmpA-like peptidoglycan-associated protein